MRYDKDAKTECLHFHVRIATDLFDNSHHIVQNVLLAPVTIGAFGNVELSLRTSCAPNTLLQLVLEVLLSMSVRIAQSNI